MKLLSRKESPRNYDRQKVRYDFGEKKSASHEREKPLSGQRNH